MKKKISREQTAEKYCQGENMTDDRYEDYDESVMDTYPETELIEQYEEFNDERD